MQGEQQDDVQAAAGAAGRAVDSVVANVHVRTEVTLMPLLCAVLADMSLLLAASFKPPATLSCPAAHQCHAADPGEADRRCSEAVCPSFQEAAPQCKNHS